MRRLTSCAVSTRFASQPPPAPPRERPLKVQPASGAQILEPAAVVPKLGHMVAEDWPGLGPTQAMVVSMLAGPCACGVWATLLYDNSRSALALWCRGCGRSIAAMPSEGQQEWQAVAEAIDRWRAGMVDTRR